LFLKISLGASVLSNRREKIFELIAGKRRAVRDAC